MTAITPVAGSAGYQYDVNFAPQGGAGTYDLSLSAGMFDRRGVRVDNNLNGVGSEAADLYTTSFAILGPQITDATPSGADFGPIGSFRLTFDTPIDPATFGPSDVALTGPAGTIAVADVVPVPGSGDTQYDVRFAPQGFPGSYSAVVGPDVRDFAGNPMDQNQNGTPGEVPGDQFLETFGISPSVIGPDAFGYVATRGTPSADSILGQPGTTTLPVNGDDNAAAVPLGGNVFRFYGADYTGNASFYVSTNGPGRLGAAKADDATPTDGQPDRPDDRPLWDDQYVVPGTGVIAYHFRDLDSDGTPDQLVVEWNNVNLFIGGGTMTFQTIVQLNTGADSGDITFNYIDVDTGNGNTEGRDATIGIKDAGAQSTDLSDRLLVSFDAASAFVRSGRAVTITQYPGLLATGPCRPAPSPPGSPATASVQPRRRSDHLHRRRREPDRARRSDRGEPGDAGAGHGEHPVRRRLPGAGAGRVLRPDDRAGHPRRRHRPGDGPERQRHPRRGPRRPVPRQFPDLRAPGHDHHPDRPRQRADPRGAGHLQHAHRPVDLLRRRRDRDRAGRRRADRLGDSCDRHGEHPVRHHLRQPDHDRGALHLGHRPGRQRRLR